MTDESWEARMAERSRLRAAAREVDRRRAILGKALETYRGAAQRPWLNGWPRDTIGTVRIGTGVHCVCCGRCHGVVCTVFPPDWEPPELAPAWPFTEADCPLCPLSTG